MDYILFIHNNTVSRAAEEDWGRFFCRARASGIFVGGSEIGNRQMFGSQPVPAITDSVAGFMRFETDDKNALMQLLELHPVLAHGGTLELCEMPKSQ